ncbi:indole-3-glycerol phosphate synthase TrpC [Desulfofalx alkaliphila]|uniref:indole-3-glycerol phosphate synthase TrpC n=1 Tax=Desulfofalx alkaliphila TaxID=105483 RepID=UPI0004E21684|nr:indole-3-glycerol phosphate synthase TrpC [Desulfofalx alkaliphila]
MLRQILEHKQVEVKQQMQQIPLDTMRKFAMSISATRSFARALNKPGAVQVIAEVKRRSPSKGLLCTNFNHLTLAKEYTASGAAAISVLTDSKFFGGHNQFLADIRKITSLPLLRKDFIIHPYQVYQTKVLGADALLLIVAALDEDTLIELYRLSVNLGLEVLVEVHNESELKRALALGATLIGINNRNLHTFKTDIETTVELCSLIDNLGITVVSESGIKDAADIKKLARHGVSAVLVGETLVKHPTPGERLQQLLRGCRCHE